jgi:aspartyl-tRNA(Asn)/glutamyl-tRNA(Gln) amidotransferase subunit A
VDAPVVARLKQAGAILIGRTNLHEFALGTTSEDSAFGPVHHPRDPGRSAGGSSGGSAAAVATGMGLASIGTDTGGSVRIPAACCGLVGLKPTAGEVPTDGVVPLSTSLDHVGPIARTVQDAAWLLDVLADRPPAIVEPSPASDFRLRRLTGYFAAPLESAVREAFDRAMAALEAAGVRIADGAVASAARISETYVNIVLPEAAAWHAWYLDTRGEAYTPLVRAGLESGRAISAVTYLHARDAQRVLTREVDAALDEVDALVLPTMPLVAPPLGATEVVLDHGTGATLAVRAAMLKHTQLFNLSGHPAITLPIGGTDWPVGLQLVGHRDRTARLLAIAAACEKIIS